MHFDMHQVALTIIVSEYTCSNRVRITYDHLGDLRRPEVLFFNIDSLKRLDHGLRHIFKVINDFSKLF